MAKSVKELETQRATLLHELAQTGDMRRGSINEVYRRCGKSNCACADPAHPGHGPFYAYTVKVAGKTKTLQLRPGALLSKIEREVAAYKHFRATSERVLEVNEQLCNTRPDAAVAQEKKTHLARRSTAKSRLRSQR